MMNVSTRLIYEIDAFGCHITVEQLSADMFDVTVSYKVYNDLGAHVASPIWGDIGTGEEMYAFIVKTVARAQLVNKPRICVDQPVLEGASS